jgi:hypothetical protein
VTENEALECARRIAAARGWIGFKPARASRKRRWFRRTRWIVYFDEPVQAAADGLRGANGCIEIDARGRLLY